MNPIYNEYLTFLRDTTKQPLEDLKEGYFGLDKSIIKGFDKQGNEHKFYRVKIENSLERLVYCDSPESLNSLPSMIFWTHTLHFSKAKAYALL